MTVSAQILGREARMTYGHDEGVGETRHGVRELVCQLDVMVVEPATVDHSDAIEPGDTRLGEETGEQVTDDAADSVRGKDLHRESEAVSKQWKKDDVGIRTSRQSSYWNRNLSCVAKLHKVPAIKPKSTAAAVWTDDDAWSLSRKWR